MPSHGARGVNLLRGATNLKKNLKKEREKWKQKFERTISCGLEERTYIAKASIESTICFACVGSISSLYRYCY